jgi:hypothetical protein
MSGETERAPSGLTVDTLHLYLLTIMDERDRRYEQRFGGIDKEFGSHVEQVRAETLSALQATEKAITKAEIATERRFEGVNEFRKTLSDQTNTFVARAEIEANQERIRERIQDLTDRINKGEGRDSGFHAGWGYLIAFIGVLGVLATIYITLKH